jgi:WD40 repeat protein
MATTTGRFFITGGTLPQDALSYVVRSADTDLLDGLSNGEFCYVLDTRQSGKSSLKVRTAARLRQNDILVADLDLTHIGRPDALDMWYYGVLLDLGDQLDLTEPLRAFWHAHKREVGPLHCWLLALRHVILTQIPGRLVLFIDEIDSVRSLPFSTDEFFAGIREWYNRRTQDPVCERLTFCLLGVATPTDLIQDARTTPFNIGRRIELNDFTPDEAAMLAVGLQAKERGHWASGVRNGEESVERFALSVKNSAQEQAESGALLDRILYWTGGHPYLTQRLCHAVADQLATPENESARPIRHFHQFLTPNAQRLTLSSLRVDRVCADLFLTARARETDDNLAFVWNRILRSGDVAGLLTMYRRILLGRRVRDDSANPLLAELKLAGIVRVEGGILRVRNRIYAREFDATWVRESMPDAEVRRQRTAYRRGLFRASGVYGAILLLICGLALTAVRQKQLSDRNAAHARAAEARAKREAARADQQAANARSQLYFAHMELAPREWENSRIEHLGQLLEETKDNENRDWEWGYWRRLRDLSLIRLRIDKHIYSVAVTPDGTRLVILHSSGVSIYDTATGRELRLLGNSPRQNHPVESAAFSPKGTCIATGSFDTTTSLWDVRTGRLLLTLRGLGPVASVVFSSNGKRIVTYSPSTSLKVTNIQGYVEVWDAETGRRLFMHPLVSSHVGATLSPDGRRVVTAGAAGMIQVWDVATGRLSESWSGGDQGCDVLAFSPDGRRIATGGFDAVHGHVQEWDAMTHHRVLDLDSNGLLHVEFSPDSKRLLTTSQDATAKVWDARSGRLLLTLRHPTEVAFGSFFPDGRRIVTVSPHDADNHCVVRVWDACNDHRAIQFDAHKNCVIGLAFSPDSRRLVTVGGDVVGRIWDVATGRTFRALSGHTSDIYSVAYSPDGHRIVTGSDDSTARVWDAETGRCLYRLNAGAGRVNSVAWSPDGRRIATGHHDNIARVWDASTGREIFSLRGYNDQVLSVAFSPDSRRLVTASADGTAKVWNLDSAAITLTLRPTSRQWLWSVAFSPDGQRIVLGCQDNTAMMFDADTGQERLILQGHTANVHSVAFSANGRRIVTGSHDGTMRLWDDTTGRETLLLSHPRAIYAVAVSPDGHCIATGGDGESVQIWSTAGE